MSVVAKNTITGNSVAIKQLNKRKVRKQGMSAKVKREIKAMKELQHPHIIALYQVIDGPSDIFLVMELAQGGDLYEHLLERGCVNNNHEANNFSLL